MLARAGFGKIAIVASVAAHATVALVAARHAHAAAPPVTLAPTAEVAAPDLVPAEPEAQPSPDPEAPHRAPEAIRTVAFSAAPSSLATTSVTRSADLAPAPSVLAAPEPSTPRFTMLVAATTQTVSGRTTDSARAPSGSFSEAPVAESAVDTRATLRSGMPPAYTAQALAAGVETEVPFELVVDAQGVVASARGLTHVGYGLDEAALLAVRQYRFRPAVRDGRATPVRMRWVVRFQLQ